MNSSAHPILFFDGVCNLCDGFVQFVIKQDADAVFKFAPLQSNTAIELLGEELDLKKLDSVVLWDNGKLYSHSDVAIQVGSKLGGFWSLIQIFRIVPKFIRDAVYNWIARNRYRWFGKKDACMIPTPELKARFLS